MATFTEDRLCKLLQNALQQSFADTSHVKVCRKTKALMHGDFVVPRGVLNIDLDSEVMKNVNLETILQKETREDMLPISKLTHDRFNSLVFHVDRIKAFRNIIKEVLSAGDKFGYQTVYNSRRIVINPGDLNAPGCVGETIDQSNIPASLTQLRAVVLLKHISQLLIANRYQVEMAEFPTTESVQDLLETFKLENKVLPAESIEKMSEQFLASAKSSPFCKTLELDEKGNISKCDKAETERERIVLNLSEYIETKGFHLGRNAYNKNLHLIDLVLENGSVSDVLKQAAGVELMILKATAGSAQSNQPLSNASDISVVHLVSQSAAFTQQQVELVWRICSSSSVSHSLVQHHLVFGTVGRRKSSPSVLMDAKEFYNVRYMQMTRAAMMKYGDHDQGAEWDDMISSLTVASISFDILITACSSQVHLDMSEDEGEGGVDNRCGPFVLYNCARLATLLQAFQQRVDQGIYPPLPAPSEVNFELLKEEEEWTIVFLYIYTFPYLVQGTLHDWHPGQSPVAHMHTHKVAHFLLNFSTIISSYYGRYHILGGSEDHLLPQMFARLSLMKAAHQVLRNGLTLLGLQPVSQL